MTIAVGATHVGLKRKRNEDSYFIGKNLAAVADGMGGYVSGDIASSTAIDAVRGFDQPHTPQQLAPALSQAVYAASAAMRRRIKDEPEVAGMGTTLVAIAWSKGCFAVASVGDSRIYLLRDGKLRQLTDDHTYARVLGTLGEVPHLGERIARFLDGRTEDRSPDLAKLKARPGDRFLLCSDGLSSFVDPAVMQDKAALPDPNAAVDALVAAAFDVGAPDNVTVVVIDA